MTQFSPSDRGFIVKAYLETGSIVVAQRRYRRLHGRNCKVPTDTSIRKWTSKLETTGTLVNLNGRFQRSPSDSNSGRPKTVRTAGNIQAIGDSVETSPVESLRCRSLHLGLSQSSVRRILIHDLGLYPYRIPLKQRLDATDIALRNDMCEWFIEKFLTNEHFAHSIWFSDEAHFTLSGAINSKNTVYWGKSRPPFVNQRPLHDKKCTAWMALSSHGLIGPFFFEDGEGNTVTVTAERYVKVMTKFWSALQRKRPNNRDWFMQDGAPPHTANLSLNWLQDHFGNRVISKKADHAWSPHSPDLNPLDYYLWGHLKSLVYTQRYENVAQLKEGIRAAARSVTNEHCERAIENFKKRVERCHSVQGRHIEHLLH